MCKFIFKSKVSFDNPQSVEPFYLSILRSRSTYRLEQTNIHSGFGCGIYIYEAIYSLQALVSYQGRLKPEHQNFEQQCDESPEHDQDLCILEIESIYQPVFEHSFGPKLTTLEVFS